MKSLKICLGQSAFFYGGQADRISAGFIALGHEITPHHHEADLIYQNNAWYDLIIADKAKGDIKGKIIMNVLDCAPHLGDEFPMARLVEQLSHADAVTTISDTVRKDLWFRGGVDSTVVYNPIKDVRFTEEDGRPTKAHPFRAMFVGRVGDPNKRAAIGAAALQIVGFGAKDVVTVGGETPPYGGFYWGVATDKVLNELYNSVDFVMMPSRHEGMGLPALEAMAVGAIPVICNDLSTREEFFPSDLFPEYLDVDPTPQSIARFIARFMQDNDAMRRFKHRLRMRYLGAFAPCLSGKGVAQSILDVYHTLS